MRRRSAFLGVTVEESRKPSGLMRTEGDLLDDADATAIAHLGKDDVLQMDGSEIGGVEIVETY
jgi:hypothetical protein